MLLLQDDEYANSQVSEAFVLGFSANLDRLPAPLFAVLDGGCFEDLEDDLEQAGIACQSLFLSGGDREMRRDGPWLVMLRDRRIREHIESLALEAPCAVFWSCPDGEQKLLRHLRAINQIRIPDQNATDKDERHGKPLRYERVLFRHWDPTVLSHLLPILSPEQLARFFGPAPAILFNTGEERVKRAVRSVSLPPPLPGPLTLTIEQIDQLQQAIDNSSTSAIANYLRDAAPDVVSDLDDIELQAQIDKARKSGNRIGLHTDEDLGDWAFLYVASKGEVTLDRKLINYVRSGEGGDRRDLKRTPAQRLRKAIEAAAATEG